MYYPQNANEALQLGNFVAWRKIAFVAIFLTSVLMLAVAIHHLWLGDPITTIQLLALVTSVLTTFWLTFLTLSRVNTKELCQQYNTKAGFEEVLYKMLKQIEADTTFSKEQKGALYKRYLEILTVTAGREQHLIYIPRGTVKDSLKEIITQILQEEGRKLIQKMKENDGCPSSDSMTVSSKYCHSLEDMLKFLSSTPKATWATATSRPNRKTATP